MSFLRLLFYNKIILSSSVSLVVNDIVVNESCRRAVVLSPNLSGVPHHVSRIRGASAARPGHPAHNFIRFYCRAGPCSKIGGQGGFLKDLVTVHVNSSFQVFKFSSFCAVWLMI